MMHALGLIELLGVFGLVIGFAVWELRRTERALRRRDDEDEAP